MRGQGTIVQVNISRGGIPKLPQAGGAMIVGRGLEGDACRNTQIHGGPKQAVLLIASETLAALRDEGFAVAPGALGENLTTEGLDFSRLAAGVRLRAGEALLELTKLRKPCRTLDPLGEGIQKAVLGRAGWYAAVVEPGYVRPGDAVFEEPAPLLP